jgi:hypothetical protein
VPPRVSATLTGLFPLNQASQPHIDLEKLTHPQPNPLFCSTYFLLSFLRPSTQLIDYTGPWIRIKLDHEKLQTHHHHGYTTACAVEEASPRTLLDCPNMSYGIRYRCVCVDTATT